MRILVVNAGSSSVKLSVLDDGDHLVGADELDTADDDPGGPRATAGLRALLERAGPVDAVGHRFVHGGTEFRRPVSIDEGVRRRLADLADLAPLHQRRSLDGLRLVDAVVGAPVPQVACFDTAFHADMPAAAAAYALPAAWRSRWPLRRYGFHGLSHSHASRMLLTLHPVPRPDLRLVSCHLGAGASLCAVAGGRSVDTTMGFTPLEGLVMATRSGSVDPGLVLWLQRHGGLGAAEVEDGLEHAAGLLGLAGDADMRTVLAAAAHDPAAALAVDVYLHRLAAGVAAMAAAMGGIDALAFTAGVGEHAPTVRAAAADRLAFLGVALDPAANAADGHDRDISAAGARVRTFVIEAREDLEIARGVRAALSWR